MRSSRVLPLWALCLTAAELDELRLGIERLLVPLRPADAEARQLLSTPQA